MKKSCFHVYNKFEFHFEPNQKSQSDMTDPVITVAQGLKFNTLDLLTVFSAMLSLFLSTFGTHII